VPVAADQSFYDLWTERAVITAAVRISTAIPTIRTMSRLQIMAMDQRNWMWRSVLGVVVLVVLLPLLLLVFLALLAGAMVFGLLAGAAMLVQRVRGVLPRSDGRENVRIIPRRE
jgi:hypothetical protein